MKFHVHHVMLPLLAVDVNQRGSRAAHENVSVFAAKHITIAVGTPIARKVHLSIVFG